MKSESTSSSTSPNTSQTRPGRPSERSQNQSQSPQQPPKSSPNFMSSPSGGGGGGGGGSSSPHQTHQPHVLPREPVPLQQPLAGGNSSFAGAFANSFACSPPGAVTSLSPPGFRVRRRSSSQGSPGSSPYAVALHKESSGGKFGALGPSEGQSPDATKQQQQEFFTPHRMGRSKSCEKILLTPGFEPRSPMASKKQRSTISHMLGSSLSRLRLVRSHTDLSGTEEFGANDGSVSISAVQGAIADIVMSEGPLVVLQPDYTTDPAAGEGWTFKKCQIIDEQEEFFRYYDAAAQGSNDQAESSVQVAREENGEEEENDGACDCTRQMIEKDMRGFDYSKYKAHKLFHHCEICGRQPAAFMCLHTLKGLCPSHVSTWMHQSEEHEQKCTLYMNILDILTSFDRIFWCERCKKFTWKYTEVYEPFSDQIAASRGSYMSANPIKDVMARQYSAPLSITATYRIQMPTALQSQTLLSVSSEVVAVKGIVASVQGWRSSQEDSEAAFLMEMPFWMAPGQRQYMAFFCVFDGHGGTAVARLAARDFEQCVTKAMQDTVHLQLGYSPESEHSLPTGSFGAEGSSHGDRVATAITNALKSALLELDEMIHQSKEGRDGDYNCVGCTACIVGIAQQLLVCANCGDSGAALICRKHGANPTSRALQSVRGELGAPIGETATHIMFPLSTPHRLAHESETKRVLSAGYTISDDRIEGLLAVPRALGDYDFKQCGGKAAEEQAVTAVPDVVVAKLPPGELDWRVVIACDGVWDSISATEVLHSFCKEPTGSTPLEEEGSDVGCEGYSPVKELGDTFAHSKIDPAMLSGVARCFSKCVAPDMNDEGTGQDNVTIILIAPQQAGGDSAVGEGGGGGGQQLPLFQ